MNDSQRVAEIAQYRVTLSYPDRQKVDYVVANVAGITVVEIKEMIEAGYSMETIQNAVENARFEEQKIEERTVEITLADETGTTITVSVSTEQYKRINAMSKERVQVLARTLRQRAAAKEREARAAQRQQERDEAKRQEGMTKRQKEEDANGGWRVTKRYAKDSEPKVVTHRETNIRLIRARAATVHRCDLPSCREDIEPGERYLRLERMRFPSNSSRPTIPDSEVYHEGCLFHPSFASAMKLLGMSKVPIRVPKGKRLPSTSPSQQAKGIGEAVVATLKQGFKMPHDVAEQLGITLDDLEQARSQAKPVRDMKNLIIHHTAPSGPPEAQAHYWVDKNNTPRQVY